MATCADCGALLGTRTCADLFLDLLALDHSRQAPWGPLHAVVTAAFLLQHPSDPRASPTLQGFGLSLVHDYLRGGPVALAAATDRARAANSHRVADGTPTRRAGGRPAQGTGAQPVAGPVELLTIHDVAVDGTFPAAGHEERVRRWVRSIAAAAPAEG